MHEFSICQTLVAAVLKELGKVKGEAPCEARSEASERVRARRASERAKNAISHCGTPTPSVSRRTTKVGLAKKGKQLRLKKARVSAGQYHRIVPASLKLAYKILTKDTPAEGSSLLIKSIPIKLRCNNCGWNGSTRDICFVCRKCGGVNMDIIGGKELCLESIEVE